MKLLITAIMLAGFASMNEETLPAALRSVVGREEFAKEYHKSSPKEQQKMRLRLVDLTQKAVLGQRQGEPLLSMHNAAAVLMAMGDDESTICAFQQGLCGMDLDEQMDAAAALSVCHDARALALMEGMVTPMLGKLDETLEHTTDEAEARRRNERLGFVCQVLKSMAHSANPAGMTLARKHRDAFAARYPSENGRLVVSIMDAEFAEAAKRKEEAKAAAAKEK